MLSGALALLVIAGMRGTARRLAGDWLTAFGLAPCTEHACNGVCGSAAPARAHAIAAQVNRINARIRNLP